MAISRAPSARKTRDHKKKPPKGRVVGGGVRVNKSSKRPSRATSKAQGHVNESTRRSQSKDLGKQEHKNNVGRVKNRVRRTRKK